MAQKFKLPDGTDGKSIHCRAAVAYAPNEPLRIEEIEVLPPRAHEVRIKMVATAVCHTDLYTLSGQDSEGKFPVVLGHEGAGIVESVGEGVTEVKRGDMVIPLYIPQCRECKFCLSPKTNLCQKIRSTQGAGVMPDGTTRFRAKDGRELFHFMGCSTFAEYAVVADISVAKVPKEAAEKLETLALLGCGVSTGYGAALNTAKVEKGSTVAVWGLGCVGLGVALGAREAGAAKVVGVDTNPHKFELARALGCTEFVNPSALPAGADGKTPSLQQHLTTAVTDGGFDYTFECVGNVNCMRVALESCHKGWGISTIIGVAGAGQEISTRPFQLVTGRQWRGTAFGGWKSRDSMPMLIDRSLHDKIPLEKFVTARLPFEDINKAFDLMHDPAGTSIRTLLTF